jgi:mitogen-activated protein kinase 1/3
MTESILLSQELLGSGTYGNVLFAKKTTTNELFACKKCAKYENLKQSKFVYGSVREIICLNSLSEHPNIIKAIGPCNTITDANYVYQNLELMKINVKTFIKKALYLQPVHAIYIIKSVCDALIHMRSEGWLHRDVKLENILIGNMGEIKLCDFSLAKIIDTLTDTPIDTNTTKMTSYICTRYTRAPECFYHENKTSLHAYGEEVDVFSLGMCLLAILNGGYAIRGSSDTYFQELMNFLGTDDEITEYYKDLPFKVETKYGDLLMRLRMYTKYLSVENVDRAILILLKKMLHPLPSKRITYNELNIYLKRFKLVDAQEQIKECIKHFITPNPLYVNEILFPSAVSASASAVSSNPNLAKSIWMYSAMHGANPNIIFYILNQVHLYPEFEYMQPKSVLRVFSTILHLGMNPSSEAQQDTDPNIWNFISKLKINIRILQEFKKEFPPFVTCLLAAALCKRYYSLEGIQDLIEQCKTPETLFDTVRKQYCIGFEDFFKKYKNYYQTQEPVLKSWLRLESESLN